jgi:TatD DNase family protein
MRTVVLTDTHCHLDFNKFDSDRDAVLARAAQAGVERILIPGLSVDSSRAACDLAGRHPGLYSALGVHPSEALGWTDATKDELRKLKLDAEKADLRGPEKKNPRSSMPSASHSKIVAVGEIGLDYYWDESPHPHQQMVLREQLDLAADLELPVILHLREAKDAPAGPCAEDMLKLLDAWVSGLRQSHNPLVDRPGVLHSFSGNIETARAALALGFCIGVTGPVTYRKDRQELIASLPLDRLLIETDSPFLAPSPWRGQRNEPAYVRLIADKISQLHSITVPELARTTSTNADRLFLWE